MSHARLRAGAAILSLAAGTAVGTVQTAPAQETRPRPSLNFYGTTGLIDMPTGEAQPDGQVSLSFSYFGPTTRRNFSFQILPRLSGTLRYSTIQNWGGSQDGIPRPPDYDLNDRSFDFEVQLTFEDYEGWRPAVKLGFRDFLGTGVYSGEYLVASKTVADDFTLTGGIGWGRLAGVGGFKNPFCALSERACDRENEVGEGGQISTGTYFRGEDAALFGGIQWRATDRFTLKAEYSSDAYDREQRSSASTFVRKSPLNFGVEYRWFEGVTLGAYYMYGNEVGVNLALSGNPKKPLTPQDLGMGPLPVNPRAADAPLGTNWANRPADRDRLADALAETLAAEGVRLEAFDSDGRSVDVVVTNRRYNRDPQALGRTARVLAVGMPAAVEEFRITQMRAGLPVQTVTIQRSDLEAQVDRPDAGAESWETTEITGAAPRLSKDAWRREAFPEYDWFIAPFPYLFLLDPDDPIRLGINVDLGGSVAFAPGLSMTGRISQPVINVPDDPGPSDSVLQPVRSDISRYYAGFTPKLARATGDYVFKLAPSVYGRGSVGYFERMFAGASGEILWQPVEQDWGLGLELNYVAQRNFDNLGFDFYDYQVATGHASLYWDTGYFGLETQIDAGRYLAGDWGGTFQLTRRFANGWAVGAYATFTDVSPEDFGEGSFNKGVTLEIPFRWTVPFETRASNGISLTSISRDGGARLDIANRLYPTVRNLDQRGLQRNWGSFWQ